MNSRPKSSLSLSDRIRQRSRTLAVRLSEDIRNGNRSDARANLRGADFDVAAGAIGILFGMIDGPTGAEIVRFLDSFADF